MLGKVVSAVAMAALCSTAALAADIAPVLPAAPPVVVAPPAPVGFDFAGAYVGVTGGGYFEGAPVSFINPRLGVIAGYNLDVGRLIVGLEGGVVWEGEAEFDATIAGRAGLVLGGRALVYASGGFLRGITYNDGWFTVGGGIEVGAGERVSIFADAEWLVGAGFTLQGGMKFHFGNQGR